MEHSQFFTPGNAKELEFALKQELEKKDFIIQRLLKDKLITERFLDRTIAELENNLNSLKEANAELEQFAYIVSHDLKEPIINVTGFIELLESDFGEELGEKGMKYLSYIQDSAFRMKNLVHDLLTYALIGKQAPPEQIDCNVLLDEVVADCSTSVSQTKALIQVPPLPVIFGYKTELRMLFQNLLTNALKYRKPFVPPRITVGFREVDKFWEFSVEDNGLGIPSDFKDRIFELFKRLTSQHKYQGSTGIGLAVCKKIAELHLGKIWVESEEKQGSRFFVTLSKNL